MLESNPEWDLGGFHVIKFNANNETVTMGLHSGAANFFNVSCSVRMLNRKRSIKFLTVCSKFSRETLYQTLQSTLFEPLSTLDAATTMLTLLLEEKIGTSGCVWQR